MRRLCRPRSVRSDATDLPPRCRNGTDQRCAIQRSRVPQLGAQFLDAVYRAVSLILQAPHRWRIIEADVRRYLCRDSPSLSQVAAVYELQHFTDYAFASVPILEHFLAFYAAKNSAQVLLTAIEKTLNVLRTQTA